jgi:Fic family protein
MFNKDIPYNDLPPLPPEVEIETAPVLKKIISASRALALFNGMLRNLPNPNLFLDTIYLQEAKASSEIENIITTNDDLFQSIVAERKIENQSIKEVVSYKQAVWLGLNHLERRPVITTNLCIEIVQCIKQNSAGIRRVPGTALATPQGQVIYTPPDGENIIRDKLSNWECFINENEQYDPLVKMALMHYQFEAIHPISDGNGRTGRILLLLYLKLSGLLDIPAIYLSEYIIKNKTKYYQCLRGVTETGNWENYILYMLDMIEQTSKSGLQKMRAILDEKNRTAEQIKQQLPGLFSKDLLEILFTLPYTKRQTLVNAGLGNIKTAGSYLNKLEEKGFLQAVKAGKEKLYLNKRLLDILEKN